MPGCAIHVSRFEYSFYANSANIKNAAVSMWPVSTSSMTMPKEYTFGQLTGGALLAGTRAGEGALFAQCKSD